MAFKGRIPERGSSQWKKNEKIINTNPTLRKMREESEGFSGKNSSSTGGWTPSQAYKDNYDAIFRKDRKVEDE